MQPIPERDQDGLHEQKRPQAKAPSTAGVVNSCAREPEQIESCHRRQESRWPKRPARPETPAGIVRELVISGFFIHATQVSQPISKLRAIALFRLPPPDKRRMLAPNRRGKVGSSTLQVKAARIQGGSP